MDNKLKKLRLNKEFNGKVGMTQQEIADEIGVTKRTYIYWEKGERQIKPEKAQQLADFFGVSVASLLGHDKISPEEMTTKLQDFFKNLDMNELNNIKPNYDLLKKVQSAYENIEKHINNPKKYENFGKGLVNFNQSYMLTIEKLIINDAEIGTNFADILINYISLNDYDKKIAFDLVQKLSDRDDEKE